ARRERGLPQQIFRGSKLRGWSGCAGGNPGRIGTAELRPACIVGMLRVDPEDGKEHDQKDNVRRAQQHLDVLDVGKAGTEQGARAASIHVGNPSSPSGVRSRDMDTLLQDLRFALRNLRRTPAFPLAAIATLALGVGATTAIFSTVNAALLRPLPYPNARDLYAVRTTLTDGRVTTGLLAPCEIVRLNDPNLSVARGAGRGPQDATFLSKDGTPRRTRVYAVTEGFFDLFGLPMTLGTAPALPVNANTPPQVVISQRVWRNEFAADPAIVGKPIRFAEVSTTIGGVAPADFDTPHNADFWFVIQPDPKGVNHSWEGYMRLKPGTTIERARSEMASVMSGLARDFPSSAKNRVYVVKPLVDSIVGDLGPILIVVLSATALLLLLACVNVTNLLLARGAPRAKGMAAAGPLGAGRGRIVRQLLTESVLLAVAGAAVGLLIAFV